MRKNRRSSATPCSVSSIESGCRRARPLTGAMDRRPTVIISADRTGVADGAVAASAAAPRSGGSPRRLGPRWPSPAGQPAVARPTRLHDPIDEEERRRRPWRRGRATKPGRPCRSPIRGRGRSRRRTRGTSRNGAVARHAGRSGAGRRSSRRRRRTARTRAGRGRPRGAGRPSRTGRRAGPTDVGTVWSRPSSAPWMPARPRPIEARSWWRVKLIGRWANASRSFVERSSPYTTDPARANTPRSRAVATRSRDRARLGRQEAGERPTWQSAQSPRGRSRARSPASPQRVSAVAGDSPRYLMPATAGPTAMPG